MDFSNAQNQRDFSEMIPEGTLCRGVFNIQAHNADAGVWETPTKAGTGKYLKVDITIVGGKYDKRHVFDNINTENPNPVASNIGHGAVKAILECSRGASLQNMQAYSLNSYGELNGAEIVFKVGMEPAKGAYSSKNVVAVYLSPLQTEKDWARFLAGDMDPDPNAIRRQHAPAAAAPAGASAAPGVAAPRWAQGTAPAGQHSDPRATPSAKGATGGQSDQGGAIGGSTVGMPAPEAPGTAGPPVTPAPAPTTASEATPAVQPGVTAPPPWMTQAGPAKTPTS